MARNGQVEGTRRGNSMSDKVGSAQFYLSFACQRQRGEEKRHTLSQARAIGWNWGQGAVKCIFLSSIGGESGVQEHGGSLSLELVFATA